MSLNQTKNSIVATKAIQKDKSILAKEKKRQVKEVRENVVKNCIVEREKVRIKLKIYLFSTNKLFVFVIMLVDKLMPFLNSKELSL